MNALPQKIPLRILCFLAVLLVFQWPSAAEALRLQKGDHICIVGNTLAERMQHYGWLETLIHARFPQQELVFRNLGYSADEIDGFKNPQHRMRSMDFGTFDQWLTGSAPIPQEGKKLSTRDQEPGTVSEDRFRLTNTRADVIFAFYGYGESYAGEAGLPVFRQNVEDFIKHILAQKYNGRSAPQLVLFSPIAQEFLIDPNLPSQSDIDAANVRLKMYAETMCDVAATYGVMFVDLFVPAQSYYNDNLKRPLHKNWTTNGIHQTVCGDWHIACVAMKSLFPDFVNPANEGRGDEAIRTTVLDKNTYWYQRYRVTDGYSTYGERAFLKFAEGPGGYGEGLSNYSVGQRELEVIDTLVTNRDKVIWAVAQGNPTKPDDSQLPQLLNVISNTPGTQPDGKHVFLSGEAAISKMTIHRGMRVQCFADESQFPELISPVQMAFDTRGRLWVATWPTYPHWKPTTPRNDRLLIIEDTNDDGRADKCTTFAGELHNITGFEFWNNGVLLAQGPDIVFLQDTNGDDKYDVQERVLHGLDTADTHHTANSFTLDAGGAMYFQEGTFHQTQIETPWGPTRRVSNGAVFRYEPRTQKLDVYASFGFANPHGHVFDRWGQDIVVDGTGAQTYHGLMFSGDIDFPQKHGRPPQVYPQRTRPCSAIEILSSSHFSEEHRGNLLVNNVIGFQGILQYQLTERESSLGAIEVDPIVASTDPNFRPSDVETAPDGTIYFTDWQNPIIGHMQHNLRDPSRNKTYGRVYRVLAEGRPRIKPALIFGEPIERLLNLLKDPDDRVRHRARIELSGRPTDQVIASVSRWLTTFKGHEQDHEHHLTEALWLYQSHNVIDQELLKQVLRSPDSKARAAGTRVLAYWRDRVDNPLELLRQQVHDESARVRLQAVWALSFFRGAAAEKASEIAVESLLEAEDDYLKHLLNETNKTLDRRMKQFQEQSKK